MTSSDRRFGVLATVPGLIAVLALIFYPVVYNIVVSFLRYNNITPVKFTGLKNYVWLFTSSDFYISWKVAAIYSLGSSALAFLIGMLLAHSLRGIKRAKAFFRTLVILPWAVPLVLSGLIWKWILNQDIGVANYLLTSVGLIDKNIPFLSDPLLAIISGIVATAFCYVPFVTIMLLAGLENISPDLYEAAAIDGADQTQKLWHVTLPLNKPQMLVSFLIIMMFTIRTPDVFFSLTYGGPAKRTYHIGLFLMDTIYRYLNFGHGAAISIVLFLTIIAFLIPTLYIGLVRGARS